MHILAVILLAGVPTIRLAPAGDDVTRSSIEVSGLDPSTLAKLAQSRLESSDWEALLRVSVDAGTDPLDTALRPAIVGAYAVDKTVLRFTPRYPLERGLRYRALLDPSRLPRGAGVDGGPISALFSLSRRKQSVPTTVRRIDPATDVVPENLLKFYLTFSAPMSRGDVYQYLHLMTEDGRPVDHPFLELAEELWDPSGRRLTVILDPGRVKRGLKPREEAGPVLEAGKRYTLVVDRAWADANGYPLGTETRKSFRTGPADGAPPDPETWRLRAPRPGTSAPLVAMFPEPLDHALLERVLHVVGPSKEPLPGEVSVDDEGRTWRFTPTAPWAKGMYSLLVDTRLEDLAGNSIGQPFEVDVFGRIPAKPPTEETATLRFEVR
jgi:hypothetical protein